MTSSILTHTCSFPWLPQVQPSVDISWLSWSLRHFNKSNKVLFLHNLSCACMYSCNYRYYFYSPCSEQMITRYTWGLFRTDSLTQTGLKSLQTQSYTCINYCHAVVTPLTLWRLKIQIYTFGCIAQLVGDNYMYTRCQIDHAGKCKRYINN